MKNPDLIKRTPQHHFILLNDCFKQKCHELRLVGGCVRDLILGEQNIADFDFATTATPDEMEHICSLMIGWKIIPTGKEHGTMTFLSQIDGKKFEITTLRKDVSCDGRRAVTEFTKDWKTDAERRDFTINAMSLDIHGQVYDYFDGLSDIDNSNGNTVVRFVGDANKRIQEDGLRILRYLRFVCRYGFIPNTTMIDDMVAVQNNLQCLENVSPERVWDEIKKVCKSRPDTISSFLTVMDKWGIADYLKIDIDRVYYSVFEKNIATLLFEESISKYPELVIAAQCTKERQIESFCEKYKLSSKERENMLFFFKYAIMSFGEFDIQKVTTIVHDSNNKVDRDLLKAVASFKQSQFLNDKIDDIHFNPFPISGADLLAIGYIQGKELGEKLKTLRQEWKESNYTLTKDELLKGIFDEWNKVV